MSFGDFIITSDRKVAKTEFILRLRGVEVAGGTMNMLHAMLSDFPPDRYDELALHPSTYKSLPWDKMR